MVPRVAISDAVGVLPVWAVKQPTIPPAGAPGIVTMKNVGKLRPRHLFGAVAQTIDGEMSTSDSYRPRITGRKAHREAAEGLVGKGCAVAAGDEDRHMLHLCQLLQAAIEGQHVG